MRSILDMNSFDHADVGSIEDPLTKAETQRRLNVFGSASVLFFKEPIEVVRGEGCYLIDRKGERYLDCYNNVACIGHGHPRIAQYVEEQLKLVNTHTRYLNKRVDDYAEKLLSTFPKPLTNVALTCTGSESNDLALREAFYFTGGKGVIITKGAYHGNTYLVTCVSPSSSKGHAVPDWVRTVEAPDTYRVPSDKLADKFAKDVEDAILDLESHGIKLAAILFDDIFSSDGVFAGQEGFIKKAIDIVHKHGGLYIADEVQPGFGRTGKMWGFMRHGVVPDIVTMGKPMGNGYPMSAAVTRPEITDCLANSTGYFNTFGGSPAAASAGMAVLETIKDEDLISRATKYGDALRAEINGLKGEFQCIGEARGAGLFTGLEIVKSQDTKKPDAETATLLINRLKQHNVLVGAAGPLGNILKVRPPLPFADAELDFFMTSLKKALNELVALKKVA